MVRCGSEVLWVCMSRFYSWCKTNETFHQRRLNLHKHCIILKCFPFCFEENFTCISSALTMPSTLKDALDFGRGSVIHINVKIKNQTRPIWLFTTNYYFIRCVITMRVNITFKVKLHKVFHPCIILIIICWDLT